MTSVALQPQSKRSHVLFTWMFQVLEALNLCLVVGVSVDYVVHLVEGYHLSDYVSRHDRMQDSLRHVGISILSGAITTLGASLFLFCAKIFFFFQFGVFIFSIILLSVLFSLFLFPALMSILGPQGLTGSFLNLCKRQNRIYEVNGPQNDSDRDIDRETYRTHTF